VTTAPPSSAPNWMPTIVRIGSAELRKMCRQKTWRSVIPFIRAVRT
jgi:hypothetical protein